MVNRWSVERMFPGRSGAEGSPLGVPMGKAVHGYRHLLHRWVSGIAPTYADSARVEPPPTHESALPYRVLGFVMLNPSTADHRRDDPTIRRCMGFALDNGYDLLVVANLFDARATKPANLWEMGAHRKSPNADSALHCLATVATTICLGWGAHGLRYPERVSEVCALLRGREGRRLWCLRVLASGQPSHPLYLPADSIFSRWEP
jgi:hypothetical protein